jgi:hypothetical protein
MATQIENPAQPGTGNKVSAYVNQQLEIARRQVKSTDLIGGFLTVLAMALAMLLVAALWDGWISPLSENGRWICLLLLVAACLVYGLTQIAPLFLKRINPDYAARMIEQSKPGFKNSLLNYVALRRRTDEVNPAVFNALARQAAEDLKTVPADATVDRSKLIRLGFILVGLTVFIVGYKMISPKDPLQSFARVLIPSAKIGQPARVNISDITPGDVEVYFGDQVEIAAVVRGKHQPSDVALVVSTPDGQVVDQRIPMEAMEVPNRYRVTLGKDGAGLQQSMTYRIVALDGVSPDFEITVKPNPTIAIETLTLLPPKYTRLPKQAQSRGEINALEGTKIVAEAIANAPMKEAHLDLLQVNEGQTGTDNAQPQFRTVESIPMAVDGLKAKANFWALLNRAREQSVASHYQLRFTTVSGDRNQKPNVYPIRVSPDLAPEIRILAPRDTDISLPANGSLAIDFEANDLDFEISEVQFSLNHQGRLLAQEKLICQPIKGMQRVKGRFVFQPSQFRLRAGDTAVFFLTAADNRMAPADEMRADPNITRSENFTLTITEPAASEPKSQQQGSGTEKNAKDPQKPDPNQSAENQDPDSAEDQQGNSQSDQNQDNRSKDIRESNSDSSNDNSQNGNSQTGQSQNNQSQSPEQPNPDSQQGVSQSGSQGGSHNGDSKSDKSNGAGSQSADSDSSEDQNQNSQAGSSKGNESNSQPDSQESSGNNQSGNKSSSDNASDSDSRSMESGSQSQADRTQSNGRNRASNSGAGSGSNQQNSSGSPDGNGSTDATADGGVETRDDQLNRGAQKPLSKDATQGQQMRRLEELLKEIGAEQSQGDPSNQPSGNESGQQPPADNNQTSDDPNQGTSSGDGSDENQRNSKGQKSSDNGSGQPNQQSQSPDATQSQAQNSQTHATQKQSDGEQQSENGNSKDGNGNANNEAVEPGDQNSGSGQQSENQQATKNSDRQNQDDQQRPDSSSDGGNSGKPDSMNKADQQNSDQQGSDKQGSDKQGSDKQGSEQPESNHQSESDQNRNSGQSPKSNSDDAKERSSSQQHGSDSNPSANQESQGSQPKGQDSKGQDSKGQQTNSQQSDNQPAEDSSSSSTSGEQPESVSQQSSGQPQGQSQQRGNSSSGSQASDVSQGDSGSAEPSPDEGGRTTSNVRTNSSQGGKGIGDMFDLERDKLNLEHSKKATDLILKKLNDQKYDPDPKLLEQMNWTKEDLNQFLSRWQEMKQAAEKGDPLAGKRYEQMLRSLDFRAPSDSRTVRQSREEIKGLNQDSAVIQPPPEFAPDFNATLRDLNRND